MNSDFKLPSLAPISGMTLAFNGRELLSLSISDKRINNLIAVSNATKDDAKTEGILLQIKKYFTDVRPFDSISLNPAGTPFQQSVWSELNKIPMGETRTYGEIAKILNTSARAVGNACRKNPIQIIVPCHRVVSAKGLGGYAGKTDGNQMNIKRWLLSHEGVQL